MIRTFVTVFVKENDVELLYLSRVLKGDAGKLLSITSNAELRSSHRGFGKWDGVA